METSKRTHFSTSVFEGAATLNFSINFCDTRSGSKHEKSFAIAFCTNSFPYLFCSCVLMRANSATSCWTRGDAHKTLEIASASSFGTWLNRR